MRVFAIFLMCVFSGNTLAEDMFGGIYHRVNRHVKISGGSYTAFIGRSTDLSTIPMQDVEFDVSTSHYGVYEGFGIITMVMGGVANEQNARKRAIESARNNPFIKPGDTVSYSYLVPNLVKANSYFALYGEADAKNVAWSAGPNNGGVKVDGMDFALALPTYDEFEDYGVTIASSYGGYMQTYTYNDGTPSSGTKSESVFVDPLKVTVLYQDERFPWVALHAQASYAPLMGLIEGIFGGPQPYGYGFGASAPLGPVTFEGYYEYFHSGWTNGTNEAPTVVTSNSWYVGGRLDVIKTYELLTK